MKHSKLIRPCRYTVPIYQKNKTIPKHPKNFKHSLQPFKQLFKLLQDPKRPSPQHYTQSHSTLQKCNQNVTTPERLKTHKSNTPSPPKQKSSQTILITPENTFPNNPKKPQFPTLSVFNFLKIPSVKSCALKGRYFN
jgi:hypothetical protein